jgi:SNF2 family DNA or RNA helicase
MYKKLWDNLIIRSKEFLYGGGDKETVMHILAIIQALRATSVHWLLSAANNNEEPIVDAIDKKSKKPTKQDKKPELYSYLTGKKPEMLPFSAKTAHVIKDIADLLKRDPTNKILVFSQWTSVLDILQYYIKRFPAILGEFVRLDGTTSSKDRKEFVRQFQEDPDTRIFLISTKAGGMGLNLTRANIVMLVDPPWNPATEEQAIDRAHRLGQTREVTVYRYIVNEHDSIEMCILQLWKNKQMHVDIICSDNVKKTTVPELKLFLNDVHRRERQWKTSQLRSAKKIRKEDAKKNRREEQE